MGKRSGKFFSSWLLLPVMTLSSCVTQSPQPLELAGTSQQQPLSVAANGDPLYQGEQNLAVITTNGGSGSQVVSIPHAAPRATPQPAQSGSPQVTPNALTPQENSATSTSTVIAAATQGQATDSLTPQQANGQSGATPSSTELQQAQQAVNKPAAGNVSPAAQATQSQSATTSLTPEQTQQAIQLAKLQSPTPSPPPKPKATGFFASLLQSSTKKANRSQTRDRNSRFGRDKDSRGRNRNSTRVKKASKEQAKPTRQQSTPENSQRLASRENGTALPGVKSSNQLFGIRENDPQAQVTPETRLAAVGGLGLMSPNGLRVQHDKVQVACLKPGVIRILKTVERHYGKKPIITSGYRNPKRNRRAGGAKNSMHIYCKAADIQVEGVSKWDLAKYLRTIPGRGGVGTYCRTKSVHIDIGKKRDWHYPCRRKKRKKRKT